MENKSTKKDRQQLLITLLSKEMEHLRKICFKYQRRPLLDYPITIQEEKCPKDNQYAGLYKYENDTHKIYIDTDEIKKYTDYNKQISYYSKKQAFNNLKSIILHELTHAYVKDRFELISKLKGCERDASPIFLACLKHFGGHSGYNFMSGYYHSDLYYETCDIDNYKELEKYLICLIKEYNKVSEELGKSKSIGNNNYTLCNFEYSYRNAGLLPKLYSKDTIVGVKDNEFKILNTSANLYEVGVAISPYALKILAEKKADNYSNFKWKGINKHYCLSNKNIKTINIEDNIN
ncbi:hypothetical protein [Clostridium pasteurianum]|uniref:SprT-like family n=1 Tax=Clostridium pasteurianum BC1 TaxID=86416 RepID=R4K4Y1_CLOPA|nr:hypothetical protein [Clostridium pasteurianum]AGK96771.1 hypothetical protein Clopa_1871 [Clostridium pasteurianum BC1]